MNDPLATPLLEIGRSCQGRGETDTPLFLALDAMFPADLRENALFSDTVRAIYDGADTSMSAMPARIRAALRA